MPEFRRPSYAALDDGDHVLPNRADESELQHLVELVFTGGTTGEFEPFAPRLVRQLLDHAPDPELLGVEDWAPRRLRADEVAAIFGEVPATREAWLLRAHEVALAWGRPLLGNDGLVLDVLGPDAPGHLPAPADGPADPPAAPGTTPGTA